MERGKDFNVDYSYMLNEKLQKMTCDQQLARNKSNHLVFLA